jgi:hypothetical protein
MHSVRPSRRLYVFSGVISCPCLQCFFFIAGPAFGNGRKSIPPRVTVNRKGGHGISDS